MTGELTTSNLQTITDETETVTLTSPTSSFPSTPYTTNTQPITVIETVPSSTVETASEGVTLPLETMTGELTTSNLQTITDETETVTLTSPTSSFPSTPYTTNTPNP